ncbi:MAG: HAD family phosphatase [Crocinitomicaceae bacterium]|nr:HAD family phosphatase [Crocinitomicaceae bacterium]
MIQENIDTIIFDFGGVLINIDYHKTIDAFKDLGIEDFEESYSQADQTSLFSDLEIGKISAQRFVNDLLHFLPNGTSSNKVVHAWNAMILDVPKSGIDLLQRLKGKYRLFLLSNTNEIHIPKALAEWKKTSEVNFYDCFDHVYLSHEMGMRKPNAEIFERVCQEQNIKPENALFIDDSAQHIKGATKVGLNTVHLTSDVSLVSLFS